MIDVATELKKRKANRIFVVATFGLFTNGLERFDEAVADGTIYKVVTTNLTYQTPELLCKAILYQLRHEQIHCLYH